ncbi:MAG: decaprenyl-phosphate phosphoribosyltransferase [Anaerolineaceae bacterium]|nr:decaprenyl-phosphate phosphoribosyltransferase [Anaerolineaceae bacterium]MDD4578745.1 decaprenyl-phosphate phosphoribosyltransferase [Anaerolineaceae bacterium]
MFKAMIETLRPRQWTKNLVIFAGLIFDGQFLQPIPFLRVLAAALLFCLVSGVTYTINDLLDIEADQQHPRKRNRPIASGRLSKKASIILIMVLSAISLVGGYLLSPGLAIIFVGYTLLILAYSLWLKRIMILDVLVIAAGFVLRVLAGLSVITVAYFSPWLFVLTTLLAMYLAFGKRLAELRLLDTKAVNHRKTLDGYTEPLLNQYIMVILTAILITYTLYTFSAHPGQTNHAMMLTIPFVVYGIFRYLYLIQSNLITSSPEEVLLKDRPLQIAIVLWGLSVLAILYLVF